MNFHIYWLEISFVWEYLIFVLETLLEKESMLRNVIKEYFK